MKALWLDRGELSLVREILEGEIPFFEEMLRDPGISVEEKGTIACRKNMTKMIIQRLQLLEMVEAKGK